jgi:uncharacterized protein (UPF0210 family)
VTRTGYTRRDFLGKLAATALTARGLGAISPRAGGPIRVPRPFRVRTITAGVGLTAPTELERVEAAITLLGRGKKVFEAEGYEVETLRVATPPLVAALGGSTRDAALSDLQALDRLAQAADILVSIGPVLVADRADTGLAPWAAELARTTKKLSFSIVVAAGRGTHPHAARLAAETIVAIARSTPGGIGNFRFAAAANIPPGTPFFPVAYHQGRDSVAVGLESASEVEAALQSARGAQDATTRLRTRLNEALAPVEQAAAAFARREGRAYLGIDPSPAPARDRSIGAAIEALTHRPFGSASTLDACAAVTSALKTLQVRTCGYAGLMLPVLEDPVLAQRANEGRYGLQELLLYSSVCGTGLDTVPLPGDTPPETLANLILDVAALSAKLAKPLSARLFPVPGKKAGEMAHFDDPFLTDAAVMRVD